MKIFGITILSFIFLGIAGFIFIAQTDLNIPERTVEQAIDNERFFDTATR